jgi:DNA gyrase subunit A
MSIRFAEQDIRCMGRTARGVRGVQLDNDDEVVSMSIVSGNVGESGTLLTVCENGFGKRTSLDSYRVQSRGGKGVIDIQTSERNGLVVASYVVSENEQAMMITSSGKVIRFNVADVSVIGRNTQGVRLMNLDDGERLVAVAHLADIDEEEGSLGDEDVSESGVF